MDADLRPEQAGRRKTIKSSNDMRSLNRPRVVRAVERRPQNSLVPNTARRHGLPVLDPLIPRFSYKQQVPSEVRIAGESLSKPGQSALMTLTSRDIIFKHQDRTQHLFSWSNVGLEIRDNNLTLTDESDHISWRIKLSHSDSVRFQSYARDHKVKVAGIESNPLLAPTKRSSSVIETGTLNHRQQEVDRKRLKVSPLAQKLEATPIKVTRQPEAIRPLGMSTPLKTAAKAIKSLSLDIPRERGHAHEPMSDPTSAADISTSMGRESIASTPPPESETIDLSSPGKQILPSSPTVATDISSSPVRRLRPRDGQNMAEPEVIDGVDVEQSVEPTLEDEKELVKDGFVPFTYQFNNGRGVDITLHDIVRLNDHVYLNDAMIMFFLKLALDQLITQDVAMAEKIHIFSTFFYTKVANGGDPLRWMGKDPVLNKDIFIIPIHKSLHWSVAVVSGISNLLKPDGQASIVLFDSMGFAGASTPAIGLFRKITTVVRKIFQAKGVEPPRSTALKRIVADIPIQTNSSDCGVYVVHFMEQLLAHPRKFMEQVQELSGTTWKNDDFWDSEKLRTKRQDLRAQVKELGLAQTAKAPGAATDPDDDYEIEEIEFHTRKTRRI